MKMHERLGITKEQASKYMAEVAAARTEEQKGQGGRPKGYKVSQETRAKIAATKRKAAELERAKAGPAAPRRPRGRPRKNSA